MQECKSTSCGGSRVEGQLVHRAIRPRQRTLRCLLKLSSAVVVVLCLGGAWHVSVISRTTSSKPSLFRVRHFAICAAKFGSKAKPGIGEKHNHEIAAPRTWGLIRTTRPSLMLLLHTYNSAHQHVLVLEIPTGIAFGPHLPYVAPNRRCPGGTS